MGLERYRSELTIALEREVLPRNLSVPGLVDAVSSLSDLLVGRRAAGDRVGFVPTMGALHDGHLALISRAKSESDFVVVSVFVNPTQFNSREDFDKYPRSIEQDAQGATVAGADVVFVPPIANMYPPGGLTQVSLPDLSGVLEGSSRPGHFDGVALVVTKLFSIVGPCTAFFGEKDFQQLQIVRRLVSDLFLPVHVVGCETVREESGLAMSSRNQRLSREHLRAAPVLYRALLRARELIEGGESNFDRVEAEMTLIISSEPLADLDYARVVDCETLTRPDHLADQVRVLVAANFGGIRLIDNLGARVGGSDMKGRS